MVLRGEKAGDNWVFFTIIDNQLRVDVMRTCDTGQVSSILTLVFHRAEPEYRGF